MSIVVTGALGHIGSRLIRTLPAAFPGEEVVMVDNLATQRYASLFDLPKTGRYRFLEWDVAERDLGPVVAGARAVVHLAAITDATTSFQRKDEVERVNFGGTRRVAESCAAAGVPLVALSTTSVYGVQGSFVDESCSRDDLKPQSPYAESKLREEDLLASLAKQGLRHVVLRFGTIFGTSPGMRFHTAVNKFCWQAVMGEALTVWTTAYDQKRPYLDLSDGVRALAFVLTHKLFDGRIYNVVTANATVRNIVDVIRARYPALEVRFVDTQIMNQLSYEVGSDRFRSTGFTFEGSFQSGIQRTLDLLGDANAAAHRLSLPG